MPRKTYVWDSINKKMVEKGEFRRQQFLHQIQEDLWSKNPKVLKNGEIVDSRTALREYEKRNSTSWAPDKDALADLEAHNQAIIEKANQEQELRNRQELRERTADLGEDFFEKMSDYYEKHAVDTSHDYRFRNDSNYRDYISRGGAPVLEERNIGTRWI